MAAKSKPNAATADVAPHLRPEGLKFLRGLVRNNDRAWFTERKPIFEAELKQPMLAILRKINEAMENFAPSFVRPAEKCLFRIYRDTRFSNDKKPYKDHIAAWWAHQGLEKTSGAGYYFHIGVKEVIIAAGAYMPEKDQLSAIRHWLLDNHAEFRALFEKPALRKVFTEFEGTPLVRPPKGFPKEHPALDLIQCKQWGLSATLPVEAALQPDIAETVIRHFKLAAPIVDALNTPILAAISPRKKVLFGFD